MTILDIYNKYQIPPNLIRHQLEVTAVGRYICDHWTGDSVDKRLVTDALLLHDMGNIIKFKRPFLGELEKDAGHWEKVQRDFIAKYGTDVHVATTMILKELGVYTDVEPVYRSIGTAVQKKTDEGYIADYADMCVSPEGIVGFTKRIDDLMTRYHLRGDEEGIIMRKTDKQYIENMMDVDAKNIEKTDFSEEIEKLRRYSFEL